MSTWVRRVLLRDLALKLISLALAVVLFAVVRSERHSLTQGSVTVTFKVPSGRVLVSRPPDTLRLGVTGPISRLQRFRFEDISPVTIDLTEASDGYYHFRPDQLPLPVGLKLSFVRPEGFQVKLEPVFQRILPVRLQMEGRAAEGYRIVSRSVTPARATVSGIRRTVSQLGALRTDPVVVDGANSSLDEKVRVVVPPGAQEITPEMVQVAIVVAPITAEGELREVPVVLENDSGRNVQIRERTVDVRVEAPLDLLPKLSATKLRARVRVGAGQGGRVALRPIIEGLPAGVRVVRVSPATMQAQHGPQGSPGNGSRAREKTAR